MPSATTQADVHAADDAWHHIDWTRYQRDVMVRGRRVRYVDIGEGTPVVLIHGQGGAWQWWLRVIPAIARNARVIAVDLAGFGASDPVTDGEVFSEHVATVIGVLDHLGLPNSTIAGHSMGGLVSLKLASDHPERINGLILINSGSDGISESRLRAILAGFRVFDLVFRMPSIPLAVARRRKLRKLFFSAAVAQTHAVTRRLAEEIVPRMASPGFMASMRSAAAAVHHVTPQVITSPSLVVWGSHDRIVPVSVGRQLAADIPDASFVALDDVGHCPMIERPDEIATLISDFAANPAAYGKESG